MTFMPVESANRIHAASVVGCRGAVRPPHPTVWIRTSPVTHAGAIRVPLLVLQGDADDVVPPAQAQAVVDAVRAAGGTVDVHVYPGEGHGWSRPETVTDELERVDAFLTRWVLRR